MDRICLGYAPGWPSYAPYGDYVRTSLKNVRNLWKMILFHNFSIRVLKLAANHEKQVFTFFAFLPPYMGASGSLMPCKRQILKRSIDRCQKLLISWHADRYWAVSMFLVRISQARHRKSIEILWKFYRNSIEILSTGRSLPGGSQNGDHEPHVNSSGGPGWRSSSGGESGERSPSHKSFAFISGQLIPRKRRQIY